MVTIDQIKAAHSKVKSGADFPAYIRDLRLLGIERYETHVSDGHTDYHTKDGQLSSPATGEVLAIAVACRADQFKADLKAHQQGQTDYPTFRADCAKSGIEKWEVNLERMTCIYFDRTGTEQLVEAIPG